MKEREERTEKRGGDEASQTNDTLIKFIFTGSVSKENSHRNNSRALNIS